tara:strand:+ start:291 stop:695 length:405 start_codon:yes stop_codon:yes gene_type:complete
MGMINGRYTTSAEEIRVLEKELHMMRLKFDKILSFVEEEFPLGRPFDYMGVEMCTTSIDVTQPRGVKSFSREDAVKVHSEAMSGLVEIPEVRPAYNAEGKIVLNSEYFNPVTGLFTPKSFGSEHFTPRFLESDV